MCIEGHLRDLIRAKKKGVAAKALLEALFEKDVLLESSVLGRKTKSDRPSRKPLDPTKLEKIKSKYYFLNCDNCPRGSTLVFPGCIRTKNFKK